MCRQTHMQSFFIWARVSKLLPILEIKTRTLGGEVGGGAGGWEEKGRWENSSKVLSKGC